MWAVARIALVLCAFWTPIATAQESPLEADAITLNGLYVNYALGRACQTQHLGFAVQTMGQIKAASLALERKLDDDAVARAQWAAAYRTTATQVAGMKSVPHDVAQRVCSSVQALADEAASGVLLGPEAPPAADEKPF